MAVKQNNTEGNGSSGDANQVNGTSGVKSTGTVTKSKKMNTNGSTAEGVGGGGLSSPGGLGVTSNAELPGCSGNKGAFAKSKTLISSASPGLGMTTNNPPPSNNDLANILEFIELLEAKQQQMEISKEWDIAIYVHLIIKLSRVPIPRNSSEDLKRFKEDIAKVGNFLAKNNEKLIYYNTYLPLVCKLITVNEGEPPSVALAIIFQLFSSDMVIEAVQSLLEHDVPDQSIRRTVSLLCEWLSICNFCQNLNMWIMAILKGLQKQQKTALVDQIALENIEQLFGSLIVPVFRPKVAPIVFHMLSSIDQTPEIFHKILFRFPYVITMLKQQSNSTGDFAESTKDILQQLVDLTSALMVRFYHYDDLYEHIELALKDFQPSINYLYYNQGNTSVHTTGDSALSSAQNANAKVGLVNLGNTCYMNSVLQALAMTKEFSREILLSDSKSPLIIKMQQQIAFMLYSSRHELTPSKVLNATRPPGFSPGLQQDSSEFLGYLLETLHEQEVAFRKKSIKRTEQSLAAVQCMQESGAASALCHHNDDDEGHGDEEDLKDGTVALGQVATNNTNISCNSTSTTLAADSLSTKHNVVDNKSVNQHLSSALKQIKNSSIVTSPSQTCSYSTIEKTFTGKLATTYKCLTCGWKSCNIDSFRDLQLSFPDVKNDCASNYSVQDLIEYYCSSEKLYGDNQYFCERCKKLSDAERYINVISAPKNLILTLKHFKYDQKFHMRAKLMHKVFHDEKVSLKVCSPENLDEIATVHYDIYAGVVHSGFSMDSGHYYTYASDATNKWYKFNDSIVTPSRTEELHNLTPPNTPYILFYQMGARSNEAPETSASTKVIKVDVPSPLALEELPRELREMVTHDNFAFLEELKTRRLKNTTALNAAAASAMKSKGSRRDSFDDEDDEQPPPASGCGGNAMLNNMNRYVF